MEKLESIHVGEIPSTEILSQWPVLQRDITNLSSHWQQWESSFPWHWVSLNASVLRWMLQFCQIDFCFFFFFKDSSCFDLHFLNESESHSIVSDSLQPHGLYSPWNSPGQDTGVGSHFLLQGIFPTQGSNPGLPHCRQILYQLTH